MALTAAPVRFRPISDFDPTGRVLRGAAADLDGTLLVSRSSFPYFFLLAVKAGGFLRGLLLLLLSPVILLLYRLVSEPAAIELLIFTSIAGMRHRDLELAAAGVLSRFYAADVREELWRAFTGCEGRRLVVTANPTVMVEDFVTRYLGAGTEVAGTELEVHEGMGRLTGRVTGPGVLVGVKKKEALERSFGEEVPDLGLGDRESDHDFMAICKEAYMVPPNPRAPCVPPEQLAFHTDIHDGRLVRRPDPPIALLTLLWIPFGFLLSLFRVFFNLLFPASLVRYSYALTGIRLSIRGAPPPRTTGSVFICNHSTSLDPIIVSIALGRRVSCVINSVSRLTLLSPIPFVSLTGNQDDDDARIATLLQKGDLVVCPDGTTSCEPLLLISDRVVPVAVDAKRDVFFASTMRGWKFMDTFFFYMNPRPRYDVTFLEPLRHEETCPGGRPAVEVANHVQEVILERNGGGPAVEAADHEREMMASSSNEERSTVVQIA
ncbi:glycerol-3-phosphate 2-O-acyltransferase 4-like [Typha angustifolia]|uniref:glycerol-3-phosphate 2-O-acyltransferase 4-like n=1 Tax=Typha angustifolia TaxID=59011 RepID=UPI003C30716C